MEKKKFNFKKFGLVLCVCFITLFAFIPFANFSNISSVSAETINTSVDFYEDNLLKSSSSGELTSIVGKKWFGDDFTITNSYFGSPIWTDSDNVYYSLGNYQYILDKATSTWNTKTWNGYSSITGSYVWTDGDYVYYSNASNQYILDKATSTWNKKNWDGYYTSIDGSYVWTDGVNYYYFSTVCSIQFTTYSEYDLGLSDGYNNGYNQGKTDGFDEASNNYYGYGPFNYSTISYYSATSSGIIINSPLTELYSGRFTSYECVEAFNGGFYLYDPDVESCMIDNDDLQVGLRVVFDTPISCLRYSHLVPLRLGFGNIITLSFTDGTSTSFNMADGYYDYIDLSDYSSKYILSLDVIMLRLDYIDIGLAFSNDYVHIYDLAYRDGRDDGYSSGYTEGSVVGYNNGYNNGLNDSNQYTFYNLFGAVLDAPVKVFSDLFNFELLGVNLLGLITGLFTLAVVIVIIKKVMGGK